MENCADTNHYIIATIKSWNLKVFDNKIKKYPGNWHLITDPQDLTLELIKDIEPTYIFFPHWNEIVPKDILDCATCICFHETNLPYGRGGSPIQNLIEKGHRETYVSAIQMTDVLDAGPVYLKRKLSLEGLAEEIFIRSANVVAEMIKTIISDNPIPDSQQGNPTIFRRRTPEQSRIDDGLNSLDMLFDHIRMLDAESYPKAYMEINGFRYEFSRPALKTDKIIADVKITEVKGHSDA